MIENISDIEKTLGLEEGTLEKSIKSEEPVKVELPELVVRTKAEYDDFIANVEKEKKTLYDSGKEKGVKDLINANISTYGVSLDGKAKTFENFAEALRGKLQQELGNPNEELAALKADNEALRTNYQKVEETFNAFKSDVEKQKQAVEIDSKISSLIPKDNLLIDPDEVKIIFKNRYTPEIADGKLIFKQEGEVIKNEKTLNPKTAEEIIPDFISKYAKVPTGGRGAGNEMGTPNVSSFDDFNKRMANEGVNVGSEVYQRRLSEEMSKGVVKI